MIAAIREKSKVFEEEKLCFFRNDGLLAIGIARATEFALRAVAASSRAEFAAVKNDLQMQIVPTGFREQFLQVRFGLFDVLAIGQPPTLSQAMNVSVDWKGGNAEGLSHHDTGGLVPNARQPLECFEVSGNFAAVFFDQNSRKASDRF